MSEIDYEARKKIVLDRLATEIVQKELAEEKAVKEAEERRLAHEEEQRAIFAEMERILPRICELNWRVFPEFLVKAGSALRGLAMEYDVLIAEEKELKTLFTGLRLRYTDAGRVISLISAQQDNTDEQIPADMAIILETAFTERQINHVFTSTILRFLDFSKRRKMGTSELVQ
jgi:hypothetical protein